MSKNGYNQLRESEEDVNSNYFNNNPQMNNLNYSQQKINPNNITSNLNENNNIVGKTQNLIENDYNNDLLSSGTKTNYIQNNNNRPKTSIKWRNVMRIDLDSIRNSNNLSLLSTYLDNFLYSTITEDDVQAVPEGNMVKLIKILQFSNECLLGTRQNLDGNIIDLKQQKQGLINERMKLEGNLINQKEFLDRSSVERKMRMKEIADYKNAVSSLLQGGIPTMGIGGKTKITDINIDINKNYNYNKSRMKGPFNGYKCKYCSGKIFSSDFELKKHMKDIHLIDNFSDEENNSKPNISTIPPQQINVTIPPLNNNVNYKNDNKEEFEKKINEMKMEFNQFQNKTEIEIMKNMILKKNNNNAGDDFQNQLEKMGNTFNETLKQLMGAIAKNNQQKQTIIINQKKNNYENNIKNDEEINSLRNEIDKTKNLLDMKKKEYDEKIMNLKNQINILKNQKMQINIDITQKKEVIPKRTILVTEQKEPITYIKKNVKKLGKPIRFHSGILESDHDDSDNERKKNEKILHKLKDDSELFNLILKEKTNIIKKVNIIDQQPIQENIENKLRNINIDNIVLSEEKDLDDFYRRYINRDTKYLNIPNFNRYLTEVLPNQFSGNKDVKKNAAFNLNNNLTRTAHLFYNENKSRIPPKHQVKELIKEDRNDLLELINQTFHGMDLVNDINGEIDPYYTSVKQLLDFDDIKKTCNKLNNLNQEEFVKSQKLRAVKKKVTFADNKKIYYNNETNLLEDNLNKGNYKDSDYYSGGFKSVTIINNNEGILSGQNNNIDYANSNKLKNANQSNLSNQNNQNQLFNTNNKVLNSINSSARQGPIANTINQNQFNNDVPDSTYSSAKQGQGQNINITNQLYYNKAPDSAYSSAKQGQGQNINITNQLYYNKAPDSAYSSAKQGQGQNINIDNQPINNKAPDSTYSSAKLGPMTNLNQNDNQPDFPYSSARHGQNQELANSNNNINNYDSWDKMNSMVESKASIGSTLLNQNNIQVQNIASKVVHPQQ